MSAIFLFQASALAACPKLKAQDIKSDAGGGSCPLPSVRAQNAQRPTVLA